MPSVSTFFKSFYDRWLAHPFPFNIFNTCTHLYCIELDYKFGRLHISLISQDYFGNNLIFSILHSVQFNCLSIGFVWDIMQDIFVRLLDRCYHNQ